jgi:tetratricopeptide (TPR) repeat protein
MSRRTGSLLVVVLATALYVPSLRNGFAYDDVAIIERDPRVHSLSKLPELVSTSYWRADDLGLYRPLVSASYAVDWAVSGGRAFWFHAVNALWNAAACGALFLLLTRFAPVGAALAGAVLFAVHPVHVEAVANVVGRAELMAAALVLFALWLWAGRDPDRPLRRRTLLAITVCFALALLSKESAIMLPALAVLVDVGRGTLGPRSLAPWLRRNAGALVLLACVTAAYLVLRTAVLGNVGPTRLDPVLEIGTPLQQRLTALQMWPVVLRLLVLPDVLLADYSAQIIMPALTWTRDVILGALLLALLLIGGMIAFWRGNGRLALILLWLPVALFTASNLVILIGVIVAERALYLPSAAVAFAATLALVAVPAVRARRLLLAAVGAACLALAVRSLVRIPEWRSTDAVFAALLRDRPDSFRGHWHYARIALRDREHALALQRYSHAIQLWPYRRALVAEAASQASLLGDRDFAFRLSRFMVERWPDDLDAARMFAGGALDRGDTTAARLTIDRALRVHPRDSLLLRMRAALAADSAAS